MEDLVKAFSLIPEFKGVPENQLQWLAEKGIVREFHDGEKPFKRGDNIEGMSIILKGELTIYMEQAGSLRNLGTFEKGEITGILPYSRMKSAMADGVAGGETAIFQLSRSLFPEMIRQHYELTETLVHVMTDRVRDFTKQQQQNDKIMALGKLSAGLAHELNNPSAAMVRTAQELKRHLSIAPEKFKAVIKIKTTDDVVDLINNMLMDKIANSGKISLSLIKRNELEDATTEWFENNGIESPYELSENFVTAGITIDDLEKIKAALRPEDKAAVLVWMHQVLTSEKLVNEIQEASRRINTLVSSIKSYTHMDQAPEKQRSDVHAGIQTTLTLLNHKIKHNKVKLVTNLGENLPMANIYVSEMNQVWTNIFDNALDAMEGREGNELEIRTRRDKEFIEVCITDNGPGIPDSIKDKIFDPFFTTKAIGKGTGLGLEIVRQIVAQHNGKIYVTSQPGKTEFKVCIPIE